MEHKYPRVFIDPVLSEDTYWIVYECGEVVCGLVSHPERQEDSLCYESDFGEDCINDDMVELEVIG